MWPPRCLTPCSHLCLTDQNALLRAGGAALSVEGLPVMLRACAWSSASGNLGAVALTSHPGILGAESRGSDEFKASLECLRRFLERKSKPFSSPWTHILFQLFWLFAGSESQQKLPRTGMCAVWRDTTYMMCP